MLFITMVLKLIAGHFIADYPLQTDFIANGKKRPGLYGVPWYYIMAGHAATHAAAVFLITGNMVFGLLEFFAHFIIDFFKCEKIIGIHQDQWLHIGCKLVYAAFIVAPGLGL